MTGRPPSPATEIRSRQLEARSHFWRAVARMVIAQAVFWFLIFAVGVVTFLIDDRAGEPVSDAALQAELQGFHFCMQSTRFVCNMTVADVQRYFELQAELAERARRASRDRT